MVRRLGRLVRRHAGVSLAASLLLVGLVTNALWKNVISGLVASMAAIALAVWAGTEMSRRQHHNGDR